MKRTDSQNNALHLWLRQVAEALNDAGFSVMEVLRHDAEIPWTDVSAKELMWKPVQQAMYGHESTADAETPEYSKVYEVIVRHIAQSTGVVLPPWPQEQPHD